MSDDEPGQDRPRPDRARRLDPDQAIASRAGSAGSIEPTEPPVSSGEPPSRQLPTEPIDVRRYQWMIGGFGLLLVVIFSIYLYAEHGGSSTPGVPAGRPLHHFVAPLATSDLNNVPANDHPVCNRARPARRGLNVCGRTPLVLAFFATGAAPCVHQVDVLQAVSRQFPGVIFAAVAVDASRAATLRLVRHNGWTIPVAYDTTGAVGELYGVEICPVIELARPGGIVDQRLLGKAWDTPARLGPRVAQLVRDDRRLAG